MQFTFVTHTGLVRTFRFVYTTLARARFAFGIQVYIYTSYERTWRENNTKVRINKGNKNSTHRIERGTVVRSMYVGRHSLRGIDGYYCNSMRELINIH